MYRLSAAGGRRSGLLSGGVYKALSEAHLDPDWVAGISIGAINSALIAGNPYEARLEKLRAFWELVTTSPSWVDRDRLLPVSILAFSRCAATLRAVG